MKIKHYLYNAFLIEEGDKKIAIDPGQYVKLFNMHTLIPKSEWKDVTHVLVTHGDPDHYVQADRVAEASNSPIFCGKDLTRIIDGKLHLVSPRNSGLKKWIPFENVYPLKVGDKVTHNNVTIEVIKTIHGHILIPILGMKIKKVPGPNERTGLGAIGFKITLGNKVILNLGDSLLQKEWEGLKPDVLMGAKGWWSRAPWVRRRNRIPMFVQVGTRRFHYGESGSVLKPIAFNRRAKHPESVECFSLTSNCS